MKIEHVEYGKCEVSLYRSYATPLHGLRPIPESAFTGRENRLFAVNIAVHVLGHHVEAAYTEGDNSAVVATDTMKNFILYQAQVFAGSTLEGLLRFIAEQFLATYGDMAGIHIAGDEQPFLAATVPDAEGALIPSDRLFSRSRGDHGHARLTVMREDDGPALTDHQCGRRDLQLIKLTGSSFMNFPRDAHTTLPERQDRPLFIHLDVYWRYRDGDAVSRQSPVDYVDAAQVRDLVQVVFHEFNSLSIQHLVHEMGQRILARFPQLAWLHFEAQNRLWDTAFEANAGATGAGEAKVYCDPRPPYGHILLTVTP
ncbi:factor-independent urate hydroxylase [Salinisphaera sp. Q1T1-3]|uniref:factor-independent urate hydroxylase n=1 Tax=Salinisphaera sp. Q1T1-3 TaxID=2321229 RepID=UPI000E722C8F|nr:urate oxidase [Salinisphaera sp. Q1T1-3]RJS93805.1 urate oxidase [Salinisphaera sp. Q1T1-3]